MGIKLNKIALKDQLICGPRSKGKSRDYIAVVIVSNQDIVQVKGIVVISGLHVFYKVILYNGILARAQADAMRSALVQGSCVGIDRYVLIIHQTIHIVIA